jgi:uncharacterized protein (TIGR03382 family)
MSEDRLERRARWLLRAYPAAYRADRGEEIIGTLLETVPPGRGWPPSREAVLLVAAGLRARRAANLRQGLAASVRQVAVAGAAMYLVQLPALGLGAVLWSARRGHLQYLFWDYGWLFYALGVLALVILAAGWSGRRGLVAAGAAAAVVAAASSTVINQDWHPMVVLADFVGPPVVVFLLFARRTERPPLSLLWLPGLALGVAMAGSLANTYPALFAAVTAGTTLLSPYTTGLSLVTVLVAVCWLATDVRPLASLVFAFTGSRVVYGFAYGRPLVTVGPAVIIVGITASLAAVCALAWLLRRRSHASPPMTSYRGR